MLAVDWGTTGFRAYRLDTDGRILDSRSAPSGILSVKDNAFAEVLTRHAGDWIDAGGGPILMSGMIGSRQGWIEVPYAACPAGVEEIAAGMRQVRWNGHQAWIAPGVSCRDDSGVPDVMRGEEMQILGALDSLESGNHTICLPGTHSKWVQVRNRKIVSLATHMTGEVFAVMKAHSILGRMMKESPADAAAFAEGVERSGESGGLLHHLFGVRARTLFGELADDAASSYLSGLLIGHEIRAERQDAHRVHLLGTAQLGEVYRQALGVLGMESSTLDPDAVTVGLHRLAGLIG